MLRKRICKAQSCLQDRSREPPMPSRTTLTPTVSPRDEESSIWTDPPYRPTWDFLRVPHRSSSSGVVFSHRNQTRGLGMARYVLIHSSSNLSLIDRSRPRVSLIQASVTGPDFGQSFVLAESIRLTYAEKTRADERTRTAYLISLRVIIPMVLGLAGVCKSRILRRLSLLRLAVCCTVLRSRWCQSGVSGRT
jgi:hypothetical protein